MASTRLCVECGRMKLLETFANKKTDICLTCKPDERPKPNADHPWRDQPKPPHLTIVPTEPEASTAEEDGSAVAPTPAGNPLSKGMSVKEAAELLWTTRGAVRSAVRRTEIKVLAKGAHSRAAITLDRASVEEYAAGRTKKKNGKRGPNQRPAKVKPAEVGAQVSNAGTKRSAGPMAALLQERMELHQGMAEHYRMVIHDLGGVNGDGHTGEVGL